MSETAARTASAVDWVQYRLVRFPPSSETYEPRLPATLWAALEQACRNEGLSLCDLVEAIANGAIAKAHAQTRQAARGGKPTRV